MTGQHDTKTADWPAAGSGVPGGEVTITRPALGETWHGTITSATADGMARVRIHSYTPRGGGPKRRMRHHVTVPLAGLKPAPRRVAVRRVAAEHKAFTESRHPRDQHGQFIGIGHTVHLADGKTGEVIGIRAGGKVEVTVKGGGRRTVNASEVSVATGKPPARTAAAPAAGFKPQHGFKPMPAPHPTGIPDAPPPPPSPSAAKPAHAAAGYPKMTPKQAEKWGAAGWPSSSPPLPHDQYEALRDYSGAGYTEVNRYLRAGKSRKNAGMDRTIAAMDQAMKDHPTPSNATVVHRGIDLDAFGSVTPDKLVGQDIREPGYLSTSVGKEVADGFWHHEAHLEINVPAGTPAFYMDGLTGAKGERELLLARGLQYKILSAKLDRRGGMWQVKAELVASAEPQAGAKWAWGGGPGQAKTVTVRAWDEGRHRRGWHGEFGGGGGPGGFTPMHGFARLPWDRDGATLHYHGSLGVDRADMPQISGIVKGEYQSSAVMIPKFLDHLKAADITVTRERVPAGTLKPTQTTGDAETVRRIAAELAGGKDTKPVLVSSDSRVIDGHHQWAAHALADSEGQHPGGAAAGVPVIRVHLPAREVLEQARQFAAGQGIGNRGTGVAANPEYTKTSGGTVVDTETKLFDEGKHPRDGRGHWIDVGHVVHLAGHRHQTG